MENTGSSYSLWNEIKRVVPQGSVLGTLLFNVFINHIFMFIEKSEILLMIIPFMNVAKNYQIF